MLGGGRLIDDRHEYLGSREFGGVIFCGCGGLTGDGHVRKNRNRQFFRLYFGDCCINHEIRIQNIP